ncbi:MAG TPA: cyclopropane fatty acyl phospholipid synthase [Saprospiraceae bacterium]|nr:cyclopropane fatty acyl phospholipid synthase [Saprospiraceae bacterium]
MNNQNSPASNARNSVQELLAVADIQINGNKPWDIQVHDDRLYSRLLTGGSLALGESYMDKWWDCKHPDQFIYKILSSNLENTVKQSPKLITRILLTRVLNFQTKSRAASSVHKHYDIGNDLFIKMLDKRLVYTCAYWKDADSLEEAQVNKMDLACRKLKLEPGMRLLDIGCGWGSFVKYAAEKYGVIATGISISDEQIKLAKELCEGLPVSILNMDYRDLNQKFDCITCFGMFEHVGHKNHREYMEAVNRCLEEDGLFLLHTVGNPVTRTYPDPWLGKYIFPDYTVPSITHLGKATEGLFYMEDLHNFGLYYDKTLMAWHHNFSNSWEELKDKYDERFYRMWTYYLMACAGGFRAKRNFLWQIVFSKRTRKGEYQSVR